MKRQVLLYIALTVLCIFLSCLSTDYDFDLFARLIVGEQFIEHGILPFKDFLSYTPTHAWFDHEWGSGVLFYLVLKYFGSAGLLILHALLMFGISVFVIKTQKLQKHALPPTLIFMSIFLIIFAKQNPAIIRCQMFSFFFFSIFLYLLEKHRHENSKTIWLIPLIVIAWNNLHGGVVSGLGIILIYMLSAIIEKRKWKQYFCILISSISVLAINPYGIKYLNFLFSAATMNRKYIAEWWPFYAARHFWYYLPSSLYGIYALCSAVFIKHTRHDITKFLIISVTLFEGLAHVKLLSLVLISAAALCQNEMCYIFHKLKKLFKHAEKSIYAVLVILGLSIPLFSPDYPRASLNKFPLYEVEFLKINNIKGNIVVPFGFGSYVSYKLYPNNLIFMDGRYEEVYNNEEYTILKNYELAESNWKDIIAKYNTEILMPLKTIDIYDVLKNDNEWVHIYDGILCGIFIKKEKLKNVFIEPEYDIDYYKKTMFKGFFSSNLRDIKNEQ